MTVFSIPEAEDYQRGGEGIFSTGEENKQAQVKVAISAPMSKEKKK